MDIGLTDELDFLVVDGEIVGQEENETTLLQAFFTDARVDNKKGYWLAIPKSDLWVYDQSRLTQETANKLNQSARAVAKELVEVVKIYDRIDTLTFIDGSSMILNIKAYNKNNIEINRNFKI